MLRNLITDIAGIRVGHAGDAKLGSGVTAILFDSAVAASVDVRGGGPGTRETALLDPAQTVEGVDAIVLSGGSAFGLDLASGAQAYMREQGRGFRIRDATVPIIPAAIMFDLLNGGDKNWGRYPPYRELGYEAAKSADADFALGSVGAGLGATTATLKGGVGSASAFTRDGITIGALAVVNAVGTTVIGDGPHFWAAPFEQNNEFGGCEWPAQISTGDLILRAKGGPGENTTIAVVATDAKLNKAQCNRLAIMAQDGFARAIYPVHRPSTATLSSRQRPEPNRFKIHTMDWPNSACWLPMSWLALSRAGLQNESFAVPRCAAELARPIRPGLKLKT